MLSAIRTSSLRAAVPRSCFSTAAVLRTPPKTTGNQDLLNRAFGDKKKTTGTAAVSNEATIPSTIPSPFEISKQQRAIQNANITSSLKSEHLRKFLLNDKIAVVTGGARGLGYNMAEALCDVGAEGVVILDVLQEHGDEAVAALQKKYNVPAAFYKVDVTNDDMINTAMEQIVRDFGRIDVLINSAGIADSNIPAETYDIAKFRRQIDINLTGSFVVAQAAGKQMIKQATGGSIIFIASMSGHIVNWPQQQSCYNASKAGVIMLGKCLAAEWASHGIRVNSISPGYMDTALNRVAALDAQKVLWTERTPMNRLGGVDELNNLAIFLASDASTFMTGSDLICDGGYTVW